MFARIEVAARPELLDAPAAGVLRRIELADPKLRSKIRWARVLDVYWLEIPGTREELIPAITKVCWDRVLQWVFTGNLMPSAAGKTGGLLDLMEYAPNRPGKFWGIERRFRPGVTDHVSKVLLEAFEIILGPKAKGELGEARASSGSLLMLEGSDLDDDALSVVARQVFCNELIETWTLVTEDGLKKNERFHQERVKHDLPRVQKASFTGGNFASVNIPTFAMGKLSDPELEALSKKQLWALSLAEMKAIQTHFSRPDVVESRRTLGGAGVPSLEGVTDVEMEVLAQSWSEHCKHKIFNAKIQYENLEEDPTSSGMLTHKSGSIPHEIDGLFHSTIAGATAEISRPWLLSVFTDNAGICALDEEDAFCIKVETHNSPSALDPYGGALTGIVGVNRDILGCGLGAKPIFNTNVFCLAPPDFSGVLPDRLLHPRRILDGVRRGVEHGGNMSGIPTVNGALVFDQRFLGKPLIFCGTGGLMPRKSAGVACQTKQVVPGDRICMVGGRIGKDGIHGATFSSLAFDEFSPMSAVQLGDPLTQKRMTDFLLEARELGLYRAITDNGAGGLSSSVGEMAQLSGGALLDVGLAPTKYPGLKPYELVVSESQERMTLAVPPERMAELKELAERRGVEVSDLGSFNQSGRFQIQYHGTWVADLDLHFLHRGAPRMSLQAKWPGFRPEKLKLRVTGGFHQEQIQESISLNGSRVLLNLLSRPNIASKEWLIRQYDHEVQGTSVIKPLSQSGVNSGPNDAGVIKPKPKSDLGLAVGCGLNPRLSDIDPYLMAQSAVDEAVRNVLCVGSEYGLESSVLALVDNFCWPDPVGDPEKTAWLVRACYGLRDAVLELSVPLVSGKDSMKNDYRGKLQGQPCKISALPTLLMTAVGRVPDIRMSRTSDFKTPGDPIFLVGPGRFGLLGSEFCEWINTDVHAPQLNLGALRAAEPDWTAARNLYRWLGGAYGKYASSLKSAHDVSEGGLLVALAECLLTRGLGATIEIPSEFQDYWEFLFGEGYHSFVVTLSETEAPLVIAEWKGFDIPFVKIGTVEARDRLEVTTAKGGSKSILSVPTGELRSAWRKEGYWE